MTGARQRMWHRLRGREFKRLGVRARVTLTFGMGALLLSATMGLVSFAVARQFLVRDRDDSALRTAYQNAALVRTELQGGENPFDVVDSLDSLPASHSVLHVNGKWYATSFGGRNEVPGKMRHLVLHGSAATQTYSYDNTTYNTIGVPIPSVNAAYFEVVSLDQLNHDLNTLGLVLFVVGVATTILGAAVGRTASGRSLRPLTAVSDAAVAIARGDLSTRLPPAEDDRELAGLTTSFNQMVDLLEERIEREVRFTSDVSHELRSPLTTLSASLEVLESHQDELPQRARRALELLGDDMRRFQRMTADLLEISRSDAGSAELHLDEVTAGELVERAVQAGLANLPETFSPPELAVADSVADLHLWVDKRRVERVVTNLIENAAAYGGGATRIECFAGPINSRGQATLLVAVDDAGIGVAPAERQRVFERFYRGSAAGRRGAGAGSGLGLSLVAEHMQLHGGRTWVETSSHGGARFVLEFPVVELDESTDA